MMPNIVPPDTLVQQLETNPRIIGLAESILQQNAAIIEINQMIISTMMQMTLVIHNSPGESEPE